MRGQFTPEIQEYIKKYYKEFSDKDFSDQIYYRFGKRIEASVIKNWRNNNGYGNTGRKEKRIVMVNTSHVIPEYFYEMIAWLCTSMTDKEIVELIKELSGKTIRPELIKRFRLKNGVHTGRTGQFGKERDCEEYAQYRFQKGVHYHYSTEFKKGSRPHNTKDIGEETIKEDGYVWVKVAEPNIWKQRGRVVWEKAYGSIPEGKVIVRLDQNRQNDSLENLRCVDKGVVGYANSQRTEIGFIKDNREFNNAFISVIEIKEKVNGKKRAEQ